MILFIVSLIIYGRVDNQTQSKSIVECIQKGHNSFNAVQKQQLCESRSTDSSSYDLNGPILCGNFAKETLHFKFDEIFRLCESAPSIGPGLCVNALSQQNRMKIGFDLCKLSKSNLPAQCYDEIQKNYKQLKPEIIVQFCKNIDDSAPLSCIRAIFTNTPGSNKNAIIPIERAMDLCSSASGTGSLDDPYLINERSGVCINQMKAYVHATNTINSITGADIIRFCIDSLSVSSFEMNDRNNQMQNKNISNMFKISSVECFKHLQNTKVTNSQLQFSSFQSLSLCNNAPVAMGPTNCTLRAIERLSSSGERLKNEELIELCHGARSFAPADCYKESRGLGSNKERIDLCNNAHGSGPAHCYRRSAAVFKADVVSRTLLCVMADSEDPAHCAASAPHYLIPSEKVQLCSNTPISRGQDPLKCLQAVQSTISTKLFKNTPKKVLGYFMENLLVDAERKSRELIVGMCGFSWSQDPLAAAECYKSSPNTLNHDDVVRMCTNISSSDVIEHLQLCHKILPMKWQSEERTILCESTKNREQVEAAVKCAVEVSGMKRVSFTRVETATLCSTESINNNVLSCVKSALSTPPSSSSAYVINSNSVIQTCREQTDNNHKAGQCLSKLASTSKAQIEFNSDVPSYICRKPDYDSILSCLFGSKKKIVTQIDVDICARMERELTNIRVMKLFSEDGEKGLTAGIRFSIWFQLFDQWGGKYEDKENDLLFSANINDNNIQGAVLWGIRTNTTHNNILQFNSLVISQPGPIDIKIEYYSRNKRMMMDTYDEDYPSKKSSKNKQNDVKVLDLYHLEVLENPKTIMATPCIYIFQQAICPIEIPESDWIEDFPRIRSYSSAKNYMRNILCSGEVLSSWYVDSYLIPDGSLWVDYRMGVDSIWTGIGMPRIEMSYEERLGVTASELLMTPLNHMKQSKNLSEKSGRRADRERNDMKVLRKAYYKKSLQWHPDRWAGMSIYTHAVQGAFELVSEAYRILTESPAATDGKSNNEDVYS
eukprot:gene11455-15346_t